MAAPALALSRVGVLVNQAFARHYRAEVAELLEREDTRFPGSEPISFATKHLKELERLDYYVYEKSDGIRCLLYCTCGSVDAKGDAQEIHYLIDRNNDYYVVPGLHLPKAPESPQAKMNWASFHVGTLIDGELIYDKVSPNERVVKFIAFDCLLLNGEAMYTRTLDKRIAYLEEKLYQPYKQLCDAFPEDTAEFPLQLEVKHFQFSYAVETMFEQILPTLNHGNDGLVFACRVTPYRFGRDEYSFRWKSLGNMTVNLMLGLAFPASRCGDGSEVDFNVMPRFLLYWQRTGDKHELYSTLHVEPAEWEVMKTWSCEHEDGLNGQIVACCKDEKNRWRFSRFRTDKTKAHHIDTVVKILDSINDRVDSDELVVACPNIRAAWKERDAIAAGEPIPTENVNCALTPRCPLSWSTESDDYWNDWDFIL